MDESSVAIVGAGQASASLAARLRQRGFAGPIVIFGAESSPPYQRPPLSKKYLSGDWDAERLWLRPREFWRDNQVELRLDGAVTMIDPELGYLIWKGELQRWSKLALTTGAAPRPLPEGFANRSNVFELREFAHVDRLRSAFNPGQRLVVVGGGYVGLETAAVAASMDLDVTVIERAPRILERVACADTSDAIRKLHVQHGVTIYEDRRIVTVNGSDTIENLELDDGTRIGCDAVLVGVGVMPRTELASSSGIRCDNGILVDGFGRTSAPDVWAAGDCASFEWRGQLTRLESVQNAIDQAETVADDMLGLAQQYDPVPWFWSDQYDVKLQIVGLNRGYDAVVKRMSERGQSHWYFTNRKLVAVDALNDGRSYMVAKKLLEAGHTVSLDYVDREDFDPMRLMRQFT